MSYVLEVRGIDKHFADAQALDGVSFGLRRGWFTRLSAKTLLTNRF